MHLRNHDPAVVAVVVAAVGDAVSGGVQYPAICACTAFCCSMCVANERDACGCACGSVACAGDMRMMGIGEKPCCVGRVGLATVLIMSGEVG